MALDLVTIVLTIAIVAVALFFMAIIFLKLLRRVHLISQRELDRIKAQQASLEKLIVKFIRMTVENKREIERLKQEREGEKDSDSLADLGQETRLESRPAREKQKAVARTR